MDKRATLAAACAKVESMIPNDLSATFFLFNEERMVSFFSCLAAIRASTFLIFSSSSAFLASKVLDKSDCLAFIASVSAVNFSISSDSSICLVLKVSSSLVLSSLCFSWVAIKVSLFSSWPVLASSSDFSASSWSLTIPSFSTLRYSS